MRKLTCCCHDRWLVTCDPAVNLWAIVAIWEKPLLGGSPLKIGWKANYSEWHVHQIFWQFCHSLTLALPKFSVSPFSLADGVSICSLLSLLGATLTRVPLGLGNLIKRKQQSQYVAHGWLLCTGYCYHTKLVANFFPLWVEKCGLRVGWDCIQMWDGWDCDQSDSNEHWGVAGFSTYHRRGPLSCGAVGNPPLCLVGQKHLPNALDSLEIFWITFLKIFWVSLYFWVSIPTWSRLSNLDLYLACLRACSNVIPAVALSSLGDDPARSTAIGSWPRTHVQLALNQNGEITDVLIFRDLQRVPNWKMMLLLSFCQIFFAFWRERWADLRPTKQVQPTASQVRISRESI